MNVDSESPQTGLGSSNGASSADALMTSLAIAQQEYSLSNPQSLKAHDEACSDFPGGNTRTVLHASPFPITFSSSNSLPSNLLVVDFA